MGRSLVPAHMLLNERLEVIEEEQGEWGAWALLNGFMTEG
jgi:hypothetical protein